MKAFPEAIRTKLTPSFIGFAFQLLECYALQRIHDLNFKPLLVQVSEQTFFSFYTFVKHHPKMTLEERPFETSLGL